MNFKLKKNIVFDIEAKVKEQQSIKSKNFGG